MKLDKKEVKNQIKELGLEISELLKQFENPHVKIEIDINSIKKTSVDWSESTEEWN